MANEDLLFRQMPHDLEGEQAVLGAMLIDPSKVKEVLLKLRPEDFYLQQNREIFETILKMFNFSQPIDHITVREAMRRAGVFREDTTNYLAQLVNYTPTSANAEDYAKIVRDKAVLRNVAQAASEIVTLVQEGVGETENILDIAEQKIFAVRRGMGAQEMVKLKDVLPEVLDRLGEMSENENHLPGVSTGLSAIDRKITGLNKSDLILLAARPGMGKTALALNMALNVAKSARKTVPSFPWKCPGNCWLPAFWPPKPWWKTTDSGPGCCGKATGIKSSTPLPFCKGWMCALTTIPCCPWPI